MTGKFTRRGAVDSVILVATRKDWRNRDASAGEAVLGLIESLREGLGAEAVGLFDDDRADPDPDAPAGALNFWDAFGGAACADIDWRGWYRDLRRTGRVESRCGCPAQHRVCGFGIHGRWALLLVAPAELPLGGAVAIASSVRALTATLPPGPSAEERAAIAKYDPPRDDGALDAFPSGGTRAGVAMPIWWVRKPLD